MANYAQKAAVLEEVIDHIRCLHEDVRAEVVVGELLDNQVHQDAVTVQMENVFSRAFARDIIGVMLDDSQPYHPFITLQLSRDGLYDRLPEGLFHEFSSQRRGGVSEMVANYKKQQQEEVQQGDPSLDETADPREFDVLALHKRNLVIDLVHKLAHQSSPHVLASRVLPRIEANKDELGSA